jgi:hypothetical protein
MRSDSLYGHSEEIRITCLRAAFFESMDLPLFERTRASGDSSTKLKTSWFSHRRSIKSPPFTEWWTFYASIRQKLEFENAGIDIALCNIANIGKLECLALESIDHANDPASQEDKASDS